MNVRPATREDIESFSGLQHKFTMRAWVGEVEGRIVGLAGFVFSRGRWFAFCDLTEEAKKYKVTIARAAIKALQEIECNGVRYIYAEADKNEMNAVRWLKSLGFSVDPRTTYLYRWKA